VFVDGQNVACLSTIDAAVMMLMGCYYVFNVRYPKSVSLTLEFLQRQMLRIRMEVSRGMKTSAGSMASVTALMVNVHDVVEDDEN
jgi:hypothetical protein